MKFFAIFVAAVAALACVQATPAAVKKEKRDLADEIKSIINIIVALVPETLEGGDIELPIPENDIASGELDINEVSLEGLKTIKVDDISFDETSTKLSYEIHVEDLLFKLLTHLDLNVLDIINIEDHNVDLSVELKTLTISGFAEFNEDQSLLTDFDLLIHLNSSEVIVKGAFDSDEYSEKLSEFLTEYVADVVNAIADYLEPGVSNILLNVINAILSGDDE